MSEAGAALSVEVEQTHPMPLAGDFRCEPGEVLALVGPSGAGKTSMLRVLAGLMPPQRGRVSVGAELWCDTAARVFMPPQRRRVGLVFQNYALMPHLNALENVGLSLLHLPRKQRVDEARRGLDHVGLGAELHARRPAALSGGQQQRVAVARALARAPRLLLLDEPFSAVDQMSRQSLYRLLAELRSELAIPIVLVTHDLNEARLLADHLVVMDAGQVLQRGSPTAIHRAPRNARVAELVGIQNRFRGRWIGPADRPGWGRLQWTAEGGHDLEMPVMTVPDKGRLPPGQAVSWVMPGDGITLLAQPAAGGHEFDAEVVEARHLGETTLATLRLLAVPDARLLLTLSGPARQRLAVGTHTGVRLDAALVHVMPLRSEQAELRPGRVE